MHEGEITLIASFFLELFPFVIFLTQIFVHQIPILFFNAFLMDSYDIDHSCLFYLFVFIYLRQKPFERIMPRPAVLLF